MPVDVVLLEKNFHDFCAFSKLALASGDNDPMYPVLCDLYRLRGYTKAQALWHTLLYVTYYTIASAEFVFAMHPAPREILYTPPVLPTGIERRGFRGERGAVLIKQHLNAALERCDGDLERWAYDMTCAGGEGGWIEAREEFQRLPNGGSWSSYKWADLLKHTHGYAITANDIGIGGGGETAGPVPGLVRLTGAHWKQCATDQSLQREVYGACLASGVPFNGLDQFETCLCDFNSLCKGHYYAGHDIDMNQEQFRGLRQDLWQARAAALPRDVLGEFRGWDGVRKDLKTRYRDSGQLYNPFLGQ